MLCEAFTGLKGPANGIDILVAGIFDATNIGFEFDGQLIQAFGRIDCQGSGGNNPCQKIGMIQLHLGLADEFPWMRPYVSLTGRVCVFRWEHEPIPCRERVAPLAEPDEISDPVPVEPECGQASRCNCRISCEKPLQKLQMKLIKRVSLRKVKPRQLNPEICNALSPAIEGISGRAGRHRTPLGELHKFLCEPIGKRSPEYQKWRQVDVYLSMAVFAGQGDDQLSALCVRITPHRLPSSVVLQNRMI